MTLFAILLAVASTGASLQSTPTHCAASTFAPLVRSGFTYVDRQLLGCGPSYSDNVLWNLDRADGVTDGVYAQRTTGRGVVVYVVDTGIEAGHDEFRRGSGTNVIAGFNPAVEHGSKVNCTGDVDLPTHPCANFPVGTTHGSAVASIVAGRTTGVAPDVSLAAIEMTDGSFLNFQWALQDIVKHAFDPATPPFQTAIVNMSFNPTVTSPGDPDMATFRTMMETMIHGVDRDFNPDPSGKKFLFVTIAGNRNFSTAVQCGSDGGVILYPGSIGPQIDGLITVGGVDQQNHFWSGSCQGANVEILAPSENILCASLIAHDHYRGTVQGSDYASGTSYAVPYVSGIAARMLEADPTLTPAELEQRIKASPSFVTGDSPAAGGRVAVFIDPAPPPPGPRRRVVGH